MGEQDDRIQTLKRRESQLGGGPLPGGAAGGQLGRVARDRLDTLAGSEPGRDEQLAGLEGERNAVLEGLAKTRGELSELERGRDALDKQKSLGASTTAAPDSSTGEPTADQKVPAQTVAAAPGQEAPEQRPPEQPPPLRDVDSTSQQQADARSPREDWEKIAAEQALHQGQMAELRDAGNGVIERMTIWSTDRGREMYHDQTGTDLNQDTQRTLEKQAYARGVTELNGLFAAHDQQRETLYANNTAEHPKVREAQTDNRSSMKNEMEGLRYEIVRKEVCALEAEKAITFRNDDAVAHYEERMGREGRDPQTIEARRNEYREMLDEHAGGEKKDMTTALHRDHFPTVQDHFRIISPLPADQQPELARVPVEPTPFQETELKDRNPEWQRIEAEQALHQRQLGELKDLHKEITSQMDNAKAEMAKTMGKDVKDWDLKAQKEFHHNEFSYAFDQVHTLTAKQGQERSMSYANNVAEDSDVRAAQMENRAAMDQEWQAHVYGMTRELSAAQATINVDLGNAGFNEQNEARLERKGLPPDQVQAEMDAGKRIQQEQLASEVYSQTNKIQSHNFPDLYRNPPTIDAPGVAAPALTGPGPGDGPPM